jgi:hypothetical protein|tara:strand:- start:3083 stop:3277 length:195 start_codon:yes stop_codon:yes gene_type:complete
MLYIANIRETKRDGNKTKSSSNCHIIDASDEAAAIAKLNNHYTTLTSGSVSYEIEIKQISPTIS